MVTWRDCPPAIQNGSKYDKLGVFSGSIVSRLIESKTVLFLFYTSVSALPIHWSAPYLNGCESQSLAISTDFGASWHRYVNNPLLSLPPKGRLTTGWRDPFVSRWSSLSTLLGLDDETNYMMIASGERNHGSQLRLYKSNDLLDWEPLSTILDVKDRSKISPSSELLFGKNFECASFFSFGNHDYIIVGVEEDTGSTRHNGHFNLWMSGSLVLQDKKPVFKIRGHGILDHGVAYAPHIFRDGENRLIQLGWADETVQQHVVKSQGWAGCLTHPRELYEISKPLTPLKEENIWRVDERLGMMTTLGIRPAPQVSRLRNVMSISSLDIIRKLESTNYEVEATFTNLSGNEKFTFNILQSPTSSEVTKLVIDLKDHQIIVDRSYSSLENLGTNTSDSGSFYLLSNEDLHLHFFVDKSIVEIYVNDRFALTSRVYPSLANSIGASYDIGEYEEKNVRFKLWEGLRDAWPERNKDEGILSELHPLLVAQNKGVEMDVSRYLGHDVISA